MIYFMELEWAKHEAQTIREVFVQKLTLIPVLFHGSGIFFLNSLKFFGISLLSSSYLLLQRIDVLLLYYTKKFARLLHKQKNYKPNDLTLLDVTIVF